jgi:hypothetical protein
MYCNDYIISELKKNKKLIKQKVRVMALKTIKKYVLWRQKIQKSTCYGVIKLFLLSL